MHVHSVHVSCTIIGTWMRANFVDCQEKVTREVMEVDFFGPWTLTHTVLPGQ